MQGDKALLTLRQHDSGGIDFGNWFGSGRGPEWNVHLAPGIPMTINADLGTGNSTLDLSSLKVTDVDVNSGTGNTTIIFPASAGQVSGTVDGGVGNLSLRIPDSVEARIDASSGIGNINIDGRFTKQGDHIYTTPGYDKATNKLDLKLDVGVGNVDVTR
jgi:predicted membrane protein